MSCRKMTIEDTFFIVEKGDHDIHTRPGDPGVCVYVYERSEMGSSRSGKKATLKIIWKCSICGKELEQFKNFKAPVPPVLEIPKNV